MRLDLKNFSPASDVRVDEPTSLEALTNAGFGVEIQNLLIQLSVCVISTFHFAYLLRSPGLIELKVS